MSKCSRSGIAQACAEAFQRELGGRIAKCQDGLAICLDEDTPTRVIFVRTGKWRTNLEMEFYIHYPEFDQAFSHFQGLECQGYRSGFGFYLYELAGLEACSFDFEDGLIWKYHLRPRGISLMNRLRLAALPKKLDPPTFVEFLVRAISTKILYDSRWKNSDGLREIITKKDSLLKHSVMKPEYHIYMIMLFLNFQDLGYQSSGDLLTNFNESDRFQSLGPEGFQFLEYLKNSQ